MTGSVCSLTTPDDVGYRATRLMEVYQEGFHKGKRSHNTATGVLYQKHRITQHYTVQ